jgi:hypothetical protein
MARSNAKSGSWRGSAGVVKWCKAERGYGSSLRSLAVNLKLLAALAAAVALSVAAAPESPAGAGTPKSSKSGFPKVAEKASTTSKTGVKNCPDGGQEAFESASGQTGLVSEVVACATSKAAQTLLSGTRSATSATSTTPPKSLGSTAMERSGGGSTYAIYWRRGTTVAVVALNTDVPASSSSSTSTTVAAPPITSAQQQLLSSAAVQQDKQLR